MKNLGNAIDWYATARAKGIPEGAIPVVGAVAWWGTSAPGGLGHVAVVTAATPTTVTYEEMNAHAGWNVADTWTSVLGKAGAPEGYIYGGPASGAEYVGHIVQWNGDTKAQKTAWLVIADAGHPRRNWIPDIATYSCLKSRGIPGPDVLSSTVLSNELPDEVGTAAQCGGTGGAPPTTAPAPPPPPAAPTTPPPPPTQPAPPPPPPTQPAPPPPVPPTANPGPTFGVQYTNVPPPDGVWFRNSPHTADTDKVTGHGVYAGEQVQLHCYATGDSVGPYNDALWYYVTNVSRPTNSGVANVGYLNAHFINDGQVANVVDPGVPSC